MLSHLVLNLTNLLFHVLLGPGGPWCEGCPKIRRQHISRPLGSTARCVVGGQDMGRRVRDVLSEARNLSKVVHGDVSGRDVVVILKAR